MTIKISVFGGAHLDRIGLLKGHFSLGQSHPGLWHETVGGVGANIARHFSRFGASVQMFSLFGSDVQAAVVRSDLKEQNIDIPEVEQFTHSSPSPTYTALHDENGAVIAGLADMALYEQMDAEWAIKAAQNALEADLWLVDGNISQSALEQLIRCKKQTPLFFVAVAPKKASKIKNCLAKLDGLICNLDEANIILGANFDESAPAAHALLSKGVTHAIVTNGSQTATSLRANSPKSAFRSPYESPMYASLTGAGDSFSAAFIFAMLSAPENTEMQHLALAHSAAYLAMQSPETCPEITWQNIEKQTIDDQF